MKPYTVDPELFHAREEGIRSLEEGFERASEERDHAIQAARENARIVEDLQESLSAFYALYDSPEELITVMTSIAHLFMSKYPNEQDVHVQLLVHRVIRHMERKLSR